MDSGPIAPSGDRRVNFRQIDPVLAGLIRCVDFLTPVIPNSSPNDRICLSTPRKINTLCVCLVFKKTNKQGWSCTQSMEENAHQHPNATLDSVFAPQAAMVSLDSLAIPVAIMSLQDGVVVYTNAQFKQLIQNCPVGSPIPGLLASEAMREKALQIIEQRNQYVFIKKSSTNGLRITITRETYSGRPHFFVYIEKQNMLPASRENSVVSLESAALSRSEFIKCLGELLVDRQNENSDQCLCCIDIDRFLIVNEKFGFQAGDHVLNELCNVIKNLIPEETSVGRMGGNEFGILLRDTTICDAVKICEGLRQKIKEHEFKFKDDSIKITVSIGVIAVRKQLDDIDYALGAVDLALRAATEKRT